MRFSIRALFALLLLSGRVFAQTDTTAFPQLALGEWRQHLPWKRSTYVTQSDSKVYFATEWAVVEIDKAERSPRFLTKVEGLSDVGMQLIRFNREANRLLLAYTNSNLDLWNPEDGTVTNLPFIHKNINLLGDKKIYNVWFEGKNAYLACGFGVVKMNLDKAEVEYTVFTDAPVLSFAIYQNNFYAGTEEGIYRLPTNDDNPADFGHWHLLGAAEGFPAGEPVSALAVAFDQLFFGIDSTAYRFDGTTPSVLMNDPNLKVVYLTAEGTGLMIGWRRDYQGRVVYMKPDGSLGDIHWTCEAGIPEYGVEDGTHKFWFADVADDFRYYDLDLNQCDRFDFNSPYDHHSNEIVVAHNEVYVATPGTDEIQAANYSILGLYLFKNESWKRFSIESNPELIPTDCGRSLWRVAPSPSFADKFYAGSFVGGLVEASGDGATTQCYTQHNSLLQGAGPSGPNRTAIGGLAFDASGNLWIANYDADAPIAVLKPDGTFRNFSASPARVLRQVVVDQNGYKWFVIGFNGGVLVYDSGDDLDSPADDRYRVLTSSNSVLPTNSVNCIDVDRDGAVWVGTQQGAVSFECGSSVFDGSCQGTRPIVTVDGFNGYLLETEDVRTITSDGANRKWFGTTNGVFVQSPNVLEQEARYTATNSPLFDNAITDIAVNQATGEVWIGTEKGLISLRGEATGGGKVNTMMPYAYPNPVRPDYDGPIAIYGLAQDANVKITDVAGNLVYEGKSLGGQAVWNGRDYKGKRAASGVYLIFATSSASFENPDAVIAKVVVLN